jgi:hypothetical protein
MIDRSHALSMVRQAELADLGRASVYYLPRAAPACCAICCSEKASISDAATSAR